MPLKRENATKAIITRLVSFRRKCIPMNQFNKASRRLPKLPARVSDLTCSEESFSEPPVDVSQSIHQAVVLLDTTNEVERTPDYWGNLPLHRECRQPRPESGVKALVEAYPEGAQVANCAGELPLHSVLRADASVSVQCIEDSVRILLEVHPEGASAIDVDGWLPLHVACGRRDTNMETIIRMLLTYHPEGAMATNSDGQLPLHVSWYGDTSTLHHVHGPINTDRFRARILDEIRSTNEAVGVTKRLQLLKRSDMKLYNKFRVTDTMLRAIAHNSCAQMGIVSSGPFHAHEEFEFFIHSMSNASCLFRSTFWDLAKVTFDIDRQGAQRELMRRNQYGRTALHCALSCNLCECTNTQYKCGLSTAAFVANSSSNSYLNAPALRLLDELLAHCPQAVALKDPEGCTPLSLALQNTCHVLTWWRPASEKRRSKEKKSQEETDEPKAGIIQQLLINFPDAIKVRDSKTRLLPFMTAAVGPGGGDNSVGVLGLRTKGNRSHADAVMLEKLTNSFELLRRYPIF